MRIFIEAFRKVYGRWPASSSRSRRRSTADRGKPCRPGHRVLCQESRGLSRDGGTIPAKFTTPVRRGSQWRLCAGASPGPARQPEEQAARGARAERGRGERGLAGRSLSAGEAGNPAGSNWSRATNLEPGSATQAEVAQAVGAGSQRQAEPEPSWAAGELLLASFDRDIHSTTRNVTEDS